MIEYIDIEKMPVDLEPEYLVVEKTDKIQLAKATFPTRAKAMEWMLKTGLAATCEIIKFK